MSGNIAILLVYEPATARAKPLPLARIHDESIMVDVAKSAIADAQRRADELARTDEFLGEMEQAEANRLRKVLALLIPGLIEADCPAPAIVQ